MTEEKLLIHSIKQIVAVVSDDKTVLAGNQMKNVAVLGGKDKEFSIVVGKDGKIKDISSNEDILERYKSAHFETKIDAKGETVLPGFVDGHTHAVWAGDRVHEFAMKLAGASYMDVHKAGGGIHYTVKCVREATEDELYADFKTYLQKMTQAGTTLLECKSGYGLDAENEIKMLRVIERAKRDPTVHVEISSTFCGAHAVPKGSTPEEATDDVINHQLPQVKDLMDSGELTLDNIDVFCEKGVFDCEQTKKILERGKADGLAINFHGEELNTLNSAEMGAKLGARAISHLEEISDKGIEAMAQSGTIAVILPTTAYILRLKPPPVRNIIEAGVAVALGSDLNPNAHCFAMPMVMHLACVLLHMSMDEALAAATINAAASLGRAETHGSLQVGKVADMVIIDAPRWEHIVYQFGSYHHIISHVVKAGTIVHQRDK